MPTPEEIAHALDYFRRSHWIYGGSLTTAMAMGVILADALGEKDAGQGINIDTK